MSAKEATSNPSLSGATAAKALGSLSWNQDTPLHHLINEIVTLLGALVEREEVTDAARAQLKAVVGRFLGLAYGRPPATVELDSDTIEAAEPAEKVALYFKALTLRMRELLALGDLSGFHAQLETFYERAAGLTQHSWFEPILSEAQITVAAMLRDLQSGARAAAVIGKDNSADAASAVQGPITLDRPRELATPNLAQWNTVGDNNCGFNGFALSLVGLLRQGYLTVEEVEAGLGDRMGDLDLQGLVDGQGAAAIDGQDRGQSRALQLRLQDLTRQLAVDQLAANEDLLATLGQDLVTAFRGLVYKELGLPPPGAGTDLLRDGGSPVVQHLLAEVAAAVPAARAALDAPHAAPDDLVVDGDIAGRVAALRAWFGPGGEGRAAYLAHMRQDGTWAGAPEVSALAMHFGVHLAVHTAFGIDLTAGQAGDAQIHVTVGDAPAAAPPPGVVSFTDAEVEALRGRDLIEGLPVAAGLNGIKFRLMTRAVAVARLNGTADDLQARFLGLYDAHYRHRGAEEGVDRAQTGLSVAEVATLRGLELIQAAGADPETLVLPQLSAQQLATIGDEELRRRFTIFYRAHGPPIIMGLSNPNGGHWSAVSTQGGAFNLADRAQPIPDLMA